MTSFFAKKAKEADVQAPAAASDVDGSDTETHTEDEVVDQTEHQTSCLEGCPHLVVLLDLIAGFCFLKRDQCVYIQFPCPKLHVNN